MRRISILNEEASNDAFYRDEGFIRDSRDIAAGPRAGSPACRRRPSTGRLPLRIPAGQHNHADRHRQTQQETTFANLGALATPFGIAFDRSGNLYAADFHFNVVEKITPGGVSSVFASGGLSDSLGIALDGSGNVYVSNFAGTTIEKFTPSGVGSVFANLGDLHARGLAFDGSGNLYVANPDVANPNNGNILRFTPGGVESVFASGFDASGLAFDSSGNLYAANQPANTIVRFTPGGIGSVFASALAGASPEGIAFDASGNFVCIQRRQQYDPNVIHAGRRRQRLSIPRTHAPFILPSDDGRAWSRRRSSSAASPCSRGLCVMPGEAASSPRPHDYYSSRPGGGERKKAPGEQAGFGLLGGWHW